MGAIGGSGVSIEEALPISGGTLTDTLIIDQDANGKSIDIDSESTSADIMVINADPTLTGTVINISADGLTTGRIARFDSNSTSTSTRSLIQILNNNPAATGATPLQIIQDAANQAMIIGQNAASSFIDYQGTAAANATDPISTLTTSGATTNHIQIEINGVKAWIAVSTTDPS